MKFDYVKKLKLTKLTCTLKVTGKWMEAGTKRGWSSLIASDKGNIMYVSAVSFDTVKKSEKLKTVVIGC